MLSYRHAFHAGNHADVLKHAVLAYCAGYLARKSKPLVYLDTHAGAGRYRLDSTEATKTAEHEGGVTKLRRCTDLPDMLANYLRCIDSLSGQDRQFYPGSPAIAASLLAPDHRLQLFELHPNDHASLNYHFRHDRRARIADSDGFTGLIASLPPLEKRALVLIDPSYEIKTDYDAVAEKVKGAVKRFATGTYLIWYPVVARTRVKHLEQSIRQSCPRPGLTAELCILPDAPGHGMTGSGMIVLNPPWGLEEALKSALPRMVHELSEPNCGKFRLENWNMTG